VISTSEATDSGINEKMETDKIKFGFYKEAFKTEVAEFNRSHLSSSNKDSFKHVQLNINGEHFIRTGDFNHSILLGTLLDEFGFEGSKAWTPRARGENYQLVGAGRVQLVGDKLKFYGGSMDYVHFVEGTNLENLESIFGKENIVEGLKDAGEGPSYLVKCLGGL
jgi:hypothetical protein